MITLTERAAVELRSLLDGRGAAATLGLRLAVRRGGCAGWQYEMAVGEPEAGDFTIESLGAKVIIAADSIERLSGCEVDYSDALSDAGFKIHNPHAARSCGCGTSFETVDDLPGANAVADGEACGSV
ncbi:MAG: iron-sulfur cluster assembly accessory protein [Verrucomicrobiales bacterium]